MRILQVVSLLSPDGAFGGPARVALNQSAELIRQGHHVTLAAGTRGYPVPPTELGGVPVMLFPARTVLPFLGFPGMAAPGLVRWFARHGRDFDVVHIHLGRDLMVMPVAALARRRRIPYVAQTHGMVIPSRHPLAGPLDALWTRPILRGAAAVFYLTDTERDQLREVAGATVRLAELPNGVPELSPVILHPGPPEVLFLARLDARKRPLLFVEMAHRLLAEGVQARFAVVGPDEGQGTAVRAAIGDEPRIRWEGPIAPDEVPCRLARASVYVLPSGREPYPMTVLEAMSVGVPVVVCDDCGLAAVVAGTGSGLVAQGNPAALAQSVTTLLADLSGYGRRAREVATNRFSMTAVGDRLVDVYRRAGA